mmetsp:Transcript_35632/g.93519  ORF Transcript_35632/g.93519 Transcript_35632/m.93519 type:complete len:140 (+) Transcript_35632:126-545(+)
MLKLILTLAAIATTSAAICDKQNDNWNIVCGTTQALESCAGQYKNKKSSTGCGAMWLEPCYNCCVKDVESACDKLAPDYPINVCVYGKDSMVTCAPPCLTNYDCSTTGPDFDCSVSIVQFDQNYCCCNKKGYMCTVGSC